MERRYKLVLAFLGLAFALVWFDKAAPYGRNYSVCLYCGCARDEHRKLGIKTSDTIRTTPVSDWVALTYPNHSNHLWALAAYARKPWGFGPERQGADIGIFFVTSIYRVRHKLGEARARELLQKYQSQLQSHTNSLSELRKLLQREIDTLISTNPA